MIDDGVEEWSIIVQLKVNQQPQSLTQPRALDFNHSTYFFFFFSWFSLLIRIFFSCKTNFGHIDQWRCVRTHIQQRGKVLARIILAVCMEWCIVVSLSLSLSLSLFSLYIYVRVSGETFIPFGTNKHSLVLSSKHPPLTISCIQCAKHEILNTSLLFSKLRNEEIVSGSSYSSLHLPHNRTKASTYDLKLPSIIVCAKYNDFSENIVPVTTRKDRNFLSLQISQGSWWTKTFQLIMHFLILRRNCCSGQCLK